MNEHVHECEWDFDAGDDWAWCECGKTLNFKEIETRLNATKRLIVDYQELITAVGNKHEGETRHDTALRYILEAERGSDVAYADTLEGEP